jgi:hypothetical protein
MWVVEGLSVVFVWGCCMLFLGQIEAKSASTPIDLNKWLMLIDSHGSLRHIPPYMGINPFTRQPCEYKVQPTTAQVRLKGVDVGSIYCAMDGSPVLIIEAQEDAVAAVSEIADEVTKALGGQFVREPDREE